MLKTVLVSVNLIGLILFPFIYMENVSIDHNTPTEIKAGEEKIVEIVINKGEVSGPARVKIDFGETTGFEIEEMESQGASFSFNNNELLFIWFSIPGQEQITLKYKLKALPGASGSQSVSGTFSYVDNDERTKLEIPSSIIEIKANENATDEVVFIDSNNPNSDNTTTQAPVVQANRTVTPSGDNFLVAVTINKQHGKGFARLKETIPSGFEVENIDGSDAIFSFKNNVAKYLWSSVGEEDIISVRYKLIPTEAVTGDYFISGTFSAEFLVVDEIANVVDVKRSSFNYVNEMIVENNENNEVVENNENNEVVETNSNSPISYKVQVSAGHKDVSSSYFKKKYGLRDRIAVESHQGWIKYTVGNFNSYGDAREKREALSPYDLPGPFVTAYNLGERISVQEALMVSNQSWIK